MVVVQQEPLRAQYNLVEDAFTGQGGFADGGYLFPYGRELNFNERVRMASYSNFVYPVVSAKVDPVFSEEPQRIYDNEFIHEFLEDCDNNGTSLEDLIQHTTLYTVLLGNSFIIMDNFELTDIPATAQEQLMYRKFPFIYTKEVQDVYSYEVDQFGRLTEITFYWGIYAPTNQATNAYLYKRFTKDEIQFYTMTKNKKGQQISQMISAVPHYMGVVPVIYFNRDVLPFSPHYSMATLARSIYNTGSALEDLTRSQWFSILVLPNSYAGNETKDTVVISNHNALFVDSDATVQPNYISPASDILTSGLSYYQQQITNLIQTADVLGTTALGTSNSTSSGVAESYKFFGKQQALLISSQIAEYLDEKVIEMFNMFMNQEAPYEVKYNDNFSPSFTETQQKVTLLESIADRNISDTVTADMNADIVTLVAQFMSWDDDRLQTALESIPEISQIIDPNLEDQGDPDIDEEDKTVEQELMVE